MTLALAAILAVPSTSIRKRQPEFVPVMHVGDVIPDTTLVDQLNRPLSLRRAGAPSIVSFAYTRCSDGRVCSLVTAKFARLQHMLRDTDVRLVELTLDPGYDRPAVLRRYAATAGANPGRWVFGTGRSADVLALAERFGIVQTHEYRGPLGHTEAVAIVSGGGAIMSLVAGESWTPKDVAAVARRDAGLRSNPIDGIALDLLAGVGSACGLTGPGGMSLLGTLAIFAAIVLSLGYCALRMCSAALADRS